METLSLGKLTIDPSRRLVTVTDQRINLGRKEFDILKLLVQRAGDILTREDILSHLYVNVDLFDRTIDSHVSHLRRKLRAAAGRSLSISSVYGMGYRLEWNEACNN